jgi:4-hydroxyphenylacetate decarboxylase large subunit
MRRGGFHIQFNVVDSKVLREAQIHPELYRGLMVRVAGFTQYWVELGKPIQDEIIARTEYEEIP